MLLFVRKSLWVLFGARYLHLLSRGMYLLRCMTWHNLT